MEFSNCGRSKGKADNSEHAYKILRSTIYSNIGYAANQGHYKVEVNEPTTSLLASRLHKELKSNGYSVSHVSHADDTYTFYVSWKYAQDNLR